MDTAPGLKNYILSGMIKYLPESGGCIVKSESHPVEKALR